MTTINKIIKDTRFKYKEFDLEKYKIDNYYYDIQSIPDLFKHIQDEFERYLGTIDK